MSKRPMPTESEIDEAVNNGTIFESDALLLLARIHDGMSLEATAEMFGTDRASIRRDEVALLRAMGF